MKTRQIIYIVLSLSLVLFGTISLVYSQGNAEQSNGEPPSVEETTDQSTEKTSEETSEEPSEETNKLESQVQKLERQIIDLERSLRVLKIPPDNPLQTIVLIFGVLTILAFAVVVFLGKRMNRQQRDRFENSERMWQNRINDSEQRLKGQLQLISDQGKDNTQKLEKITSTQSNISDEREKFFTSLAKIKSRLDDVELKFVNVEPDGETDDTIDYQPEVALFIEDAQDRLEELLHAYTNGEPIDLGEIENPSPSQKAILLLNSLARDLHQWKTESEHSGQADSNLIETLTYREVDIRDKLKEIRGESTPTPKTLDVPTDVNTDAELNAFQNQCDVHVARYEGMLSGFEQGREVDLEAYNEFILQFIKDRLFNGVARFVPFDQLPEQLVIFLQFIGYEVVPIEIGKTEADARVYDIQGSRQTGVEPGTIAEVVLPGLQRKTDGEIVQKPVVIRGE